MSRIVGTQNFILEHKDHNISTSIVSITNTVFSCEVTESGGQNYIQIIDKQDESLVEDTGAYLYCHTCDVEEEINLSEVEY